MAARISTTAEGIMRGITNLYHLKLQARFAKPQAKPNARWQLRTDFGKKDYYIDACCHCGYDLGEITLNSSEVVCVDSPLHYLSKCPSCLKEVSVILGSKILPQELPEDIRQYKPLMSKAEHICVQTYGTLNEGYIERILTEQAIPVIGPKDWDKTGFPIVYECGTLDEDVIEENEKYKGFTLECSNVIPISFRIEGVYQVYKLMPQSTTKFIGTMNFSTPSEDGRFYLHGCDCDCEESGYLDCTQAYLSDLNSSFIHKPCSSGETDTEFSFNDV